MIQAILGKQDIVNSTERKRRYECEKIQRIGIDKFYSIIYFIRYTHF